MEQKFPGVVVYICCKDDYFYLVEEQPRVLRQSELKDKKNQFAYVREITCDMQSNPIEQFMSESDIDVPIIAKNQNTSKKNCVILTNGTLPVKSLSGEQIQKIINYSKSKGCEPQLNQNYKDFDWIIGVENENLYLAASEGKNVTLIPTGFGENLFKRMFPDAEILKL